MRLSPDRFINLYKTQQQQDEKYFLVENNNIDYVDDYYESIARYSIKNVENLGKKENFEQIRKQEMFKICGNNFTKYLCVYKKKPFVFDSTKTEKDLIVLCDNLQDPGNLGSIIRNMKAFGYEKLIITGDIFPFHHKVIEASRGYVFQTQIQQASYEWIEKMNDYNFIGTHPLGDNIYTIKSLPQKSILVFGNETKGISEFLKSKITKTISIPVAIESLNVSVSNGIILSFWSQN